MTKLLLILRASLVVAVVASAFSGTAFASPVSLIGGTPDGVIYDVDPMTGLAANPRDTGIDDLRGLAFTVSGTLYGWAGDGSTPPRTLYEIDSTDGAAASLVPTRWVGFDFEVAPDSGLLYASLTCGLGSACALFTFDPVSFVSRTVGDIAILGASIAVRSDGAVFALGSLTRDGLVNAIIEVNPLTAMTIQRWDLPFLVGRTGTTFLPDGTLLFVDGGPNGTGNLRGFDPTTGDFWMIGNSGISSGLTALAFVPVPATLVLLVVGALTTLCARRVGGASEVRQLERTRALRPRWRC